MANMAHSGAFLEWLKEAGIVPEQTKAVTISAGINGPVMVYVDMYLPASAIKADARAVFGGAQAVVQSREYTPPRGIVDPKVIDRPDPTV